MSQYTGRLTEADRKAIDDLEETMSQRKIASFLGLTYGSVRYYLDWKHKENRSGIGVAGKQPLKPPATGPKILVFDIETAPYLISSWGTFKPFAIDIEREWYMLSFAYGWYDINKQELGPIQFLCLADDPNFTAGSTDDSRLVASLWRLFDEAEVIVGQNHERFDIKKANERFFVHHMTPPSPYVTIDTRRIWNRNFSGSAKLKYMARKADVALKETNRGFSLWQDCMNNIGSAWAEMKQYNVADVKATAELYTRLLPWIDSPTSNTVNFGHWKQGDWTCKKCMNTTEDRGGEGFVKRGFHRTAASVFQTVQCRKCQGYSRLYQRIPQRHQDDKTFLR